MFSKNIIKLILKFLKYNCIWCNRIILINIVNIYNKIDICDLCKKNWFYINQYHFNIKI